MTVLAKRLGGLSVLSLAVAGPALAPMSAIGEAVGGSVACFAGGFLLVIGAVTLDPVAAVIGGLALTGCN